MRFPLPRVRFATWRMMIAVAAVALMFWGVGLLSLATTYRSQARDFSAKAEQAEFDAEVVTAAEGPHSDRSDPANHGDAKLHAHYQQLASHYLTLAKKYERAALRPWRAVEPDPPWPSL